MTDITRHIRDALIKIIAADSGREMMHARYEFDKTCTPAALTALLARLDAVELDSKLLDWLDRELACPLTLYDGRYLNLGDKSVRQVISEAMKGKL